MEQNVFTEFSRLIFKPDDAILAGSDILKTDKEHQNIKNFDRSVCYNAYTSLRNGNM